MTCLSVDLPLDCLSIDYYEGCSRDNVLHNAMCYEV